jgi:SAM-dependent methyltransferase
MDFREFEVMYRSEETHWWYRGLRAVMFRRTGLNRPASRKWRILDAGCGAGGSLAALRQTHHIHAQGFDYSEPALYFCRRRGLNNVRRGSVTDIPFPDEVFDLAYSNDVISDAGTTDEMKAYAELLRVLKPGGLLFVNMPAYEYLRSEHDKAVNIGRRYTMKSLRRKLEDAGFEIVRISHWNVFLFPVVLLVRLLRKRGAGSADARSDIEVPTAPLNALLSAVVELEARLSDYISFPFGSSIFCLARKPAQAKKGKS